MKELNAKESEQFRVGANDSGSRRNTATTPGGAWQLLLR